MPHHLSSAPTLAPSFGIYLTKVKQPLRVFAGIDPQGKSNNKARPQSISNPSAPKYRGFKRSPPQEAEDQSLSFSV